MNRQGRGFAKTQMRLIEVVDALLRSPASPAMVSSRAPEGCVAIPGSHVSSRVPIHWDAAISFKLKRDCFTPARPGFAMTHCSQEIASVASLPRNDTMNRQGRPCDKPRGFPHPYAEKTTAMGRGLIGIRDVACFARCHGHCPWGSMGMGWFPDAFDRDGAPHLPSPLKIYRW